MFGRRRKVLLTTRSGEMNKDEMLKRTLITKHLEGWSGLERLSIKSYMETGKISGSLFMAIKSLMSEYLKLVAEKGVAK